GRTETAYGSYKFRVLPNKDYLETTPVENQSYTGDTYKYTEKWLYTPDSYSIYYSESDFTEELSNSTTDLSDRLSLEDGNSGKVYTEMPGYKDVIVDSNNTHTPHVVYYYVVSNDPNYASITGSCSVDILPVPVSVTAVKAFTKVYDGTTTIKGKPDDGYAGTVTYKYDEEDGTYSDYYRLQSGIEGENQSASPYYKINGILSVDSSKTMMLNFDAEFDYKHAKGSGVQEGTIVTLSNLWVLSSDSSSELHDVYENWNYYFPSGQTLQLSGQINPYPLDIKWLPDSESDADSTYQDSDFTYNYTGSPQAPYIKIVGNTDRIPDSSSAFSVDVKNKQTNAGTYSAIPEVEAAGDYYSTDYTFTLENQTYTILKRYIMVAPKSVTKTYNASNQTMLDYESALNVDGEYVFTTKETEDGTYTLYTMPEGEYYSVSASESHKDAGTYEGISAQNLSVYTIKNNKKNVITDNYEIEYGYGTLTIEPCPVIITGITGIDKEYDGTTDADLDISSASIKLALDGTSGIYSGDSLVLEKVGYNGSGYEDGYGYPGTFDVATVQNDRTVTISYITDALDTKGIAIKNESGTSYNNYAIKISESQQTTTANIIKNGKANIYIKGEDTTITYGESLDSSYFEYEIQGLVEGESLSASEGYPQFMIMKTDGDNYVNAVRDNHIFTQTNNLDFIEDLDVGTYYVFFVETTTTDGDGNIVDDDSNHFVAGFESDKYNVSWNSDDPVTITIEPRKIAVAGIDTEASISKVYDGTTSVDSDSKDTIKGSNTSHPYYEFTTVDGETISGVRSEDAAKLVLSSFDAVYNSENVAVTENNLIVGATKVNITNAVLGGDKASDYELVNTSFNVPGDITPKDLTVKINNQEVTYGEAVTSYSFTIDGAVNDEDMEIINTGLTNSTVTKINCNYEAVASPSGSNSHDVGYYAMNVDETTRYSNSNYSITYAEATGELGNTYGLLSVIKKNLTYKAKEVYVNYGVENPPSIYDGEFAATEFVYGDNIKTVKNEDETAKIVSDGTDGYISVFTDEACSESAGTYEVQFTCEVNSTSLPGKYDVVPSNVASQEGGLYTQNYNIVVEKGTLEIKKYYILIEGLEVGEKVYDGTTSIDDAQIGLENVRFSYYIGATGYSDRTYSQLQSDISGAVFDVSNITAEYTDKNVGTGKEVTLTISLGTDSELSKRYELLTATNKAEAETYDTSSIFDDTSGNIKASQTTTTADITARPLSLKPGDISVNYAQAVSDDQIVISDVSVGTGSGFITGESFSDITGYSKGYKITPANSEEVYAAGSDTGSYVIDISSTLPGDGEQGNYNITFNTGTLTVNKVTFPAPAGITWTGGKLSWNAVASIGNVQVGGYKLEITKVGEENAFETVECSTTEYDFAEIIRTKGNGQYKVNICAVASSDNNEGYKNVNQYGEAAVSPVKYAVLVTPVYSEDEVTAKATDIKADKNVYVTENSLLESYVVIAGEETALNALYSWATEGQDSQTYTTGYVLESFTSSISNGVTVDTVADNSSTGSFLGTVTVSDDIQAISINVILKLKKDEAEGTLSISGSSDPVPYGALEHPEYSADVTHTQDIAYSYTYEWYYTLGDITYNKDMSGVYDVVKTIDSEGNITTTNTDIVWNEQTFTFPRGKRAQTYKVYCNVIATRKDNGLTKELLAEKDFVITKASQGDSSYL
nr:hypothetical protein [Butyrivibrio sp.]